MEIAAYVLQEIAACDGDGGTAVSPLPLLINHRRSITPDEDEVADALALLQERRLVVRVADRYVLSPLMRLRAPKEADGAIATSGQAWIRLCGSLGLTDGEA